MESNVQSTLNPAAALEGGPVNSTPEDFLKELRALRLRMPPSPEAPTAGRPGRLTNVNPAFVASAANAVGASEFVSSALGRTDEDIRQEVDAASRWSAVADELRSLLKEVVSANNIRRQRVGLAALQTYKICQQLTRNQEHGKLEAHVAEMKRHNKFSRRRPKAQPESPPAPPPATAPQKPTA